MRTWSEALSLDTHPKNYSHGDARVARGPRRRSDLEDDDHIRCFVQPARRNIADGNPLLGYVDARAR